MQTKLSSESMIQCKVQIGEKRMEEVITSTYYVRMVGWIEKRGGYCIKVMYGRGVSKGIKKGIKYSIILPTTYYVISKRHRDGIRHSNHECVQGKLSM